MFPGELSISTVRRAAPATKTHLKHFKHTQKRNFHQNTTTLTTTVLSRRQTPQRLFNKSTQVNADRSPSRQNTSAVLSSAPKVNGVTSDGRAPYIKDAIGRHDAIPSKGPLWTDGQQITKERGVSSPSQREETGSYDFIATRPFKNFSSDWDNQNGLG